MWGHVVGGSSLGEDHHGGYCDDTANVIVSQAHQVDSGFHFDKGGDMLRPEPLDLVLIALVGILLFGANRLPETARSIGKAMREFRDAVSGKETETPGKN